MLLFVNNSISSQGDLSLREAYVATKTIYREHRNQFCVSRYDL